MAKYGFSPVGIAEEENALNYDLFPNPASNTISLKLGQNSIKPSAINVYSADGCFMKSVKGVNQLRNDIFTIDISGFAAGVYFVELSDGMQKSVRKFMKYD